MENRVGKKLKLTIPTFSTEVGSISSVVWSLICTFLARWRVWSDQKCMLYADCYLSLLSDSRARVLLWYKLELSDSLRCWKSFPNPALRVLCNTTSCQCVRGLCLKMFSNAWADKVFKTCSVAKIEKNVTYLFCQAENGSWLQVSEEQVQELIAA